jgi:O-methyltransferase
LKAITAVKLLFNALGKGDEYSRYAFAQKLSERIYPRYKFSEFGSLFLYDEAFIRYYESFQGTSNYRSLDRKYVLDQLAKLTASIEGDTAECGAFQGASSYLICRHLARTQKKHHIFDSFEGLSSPDSEDGDYWTAGNLASAEEVIRGKLKEFDCVIYHKGWIPDRFADVSDVKFSFLHVDVDLYQPTLDSLSFFYSRMSPGGIILSDDYGHSFCPGAKRAMDTFFANKPEPLVSLPTAQAFVIKERG